MAAAKKPYRPPKGKRPDTTPVTCTPDQAYAIYVTLDPLSGSEVARQLQAQGHKISKDVVCHWARKFNWKGKVLAMRERDAKTPEQFKSMMDNLVLEGQQYGHQQLTGVQARIAQHLANKITQVELTTPTDFKIMVEVMHDLASEIHALRGFAIGEKGADGDPPGGGKTDKDKVLQLRIGDKR